MSSVDSITITSVSTVNQITITDTSGITVTTVGTQGLAGPSAIMARGIDQDTAGASNNGALLIYDNANVKWTANDTTEGKQLTQKLFNLQIGESGATVTTILDEDNFSSDSATALATQQSIKAYIASQITLEDLDITDGSSTIAIDLDSETLGLLGGVGISSTASGNNVTFAIDATVVTLTGTQTLTNKTLTSPTLTSPVLNTGISGSAFLDEDDMSSNSATKLASQQSIKAYVDNQLTLEDLDVTDGSNNGSIDLDSEVLGLLGGTGLTSSLSGNNFTFAIDGTVATLTGTQTLTNKTLTSPKINGSTAITTTGTEINVLDGDTSASSVVIVDADQLIVNDNGTMKQIAVTRLDTYFSSTTATLTNKTLTSPVLNGTLSGTAFKDEDNMASDSATAVASQQSIKAFVESQITAQDLDVSDGSNDISIDLDSETLTLAGGTGIDSTANTNTVTFAIDNTVATLTGSQTLTNKTIDVDNNTVSNIEVDNLKSGVLDTDLSSVAGTDTTLASAKAIKTYVDSQVTAQDLDISDGSSTIAIDLDSETLSLLGGTGVTSTASGNGVTFAIGQSVGTSDNVVFNQVTSALVGNASTATTLQTARTIGGVSFDGSANIDLAGVNSTGNQDTTGNAATATALANARTVALSGDVTASAVSFDGTGNITLSTTIGADSVALGTDTTGNFVAGISGTTNEIEVSGSGSENATVTIGLPDNVTITGNLTVNGTTTTVNTSTLEVEDPLIKLAKANSGADSVDIGFYGLYDTSGSQDLYAGLFRDANDSGKFKLFKDLQAEPTTTVNTSGTGYAVGTLVATFEGNITGNVTGNVSGTAATVTGAAQSNITSLGTLTALQVDNININGNTISSTAGTDLNITPLTGQQIVLDGTIIIDAGVVTGATSITSTAFVGALTGDVTGNVSGNAGTATTLANSRNFSISGDITASAISFDGSGNVALSATIDDNVVGAAQLNISGNGTAGQAVLSDGDGSFSYGDASKTTEEIQDIVGGMVSSNTETGITVTYEDGDGTLDFVINPAQTTITSLLATDIKIGEDDQTKIDFGTADEIHFFAANENQLKLTNGALVPATDNDIDLGTSSVEFKNAFFDGTVTSDAFAGALTGDVTGNASTATALETARTIGGTSFDGTSNISVALADTATALATARNIGGVSFDGTANINLAGVNTTGNQDTTGNAATATKLATARTIGGTSFDGSANIAVALASTATTLANARTINGVSFDGSANITTLTAGTGVSVSGTEVSIGQAVATSNSPTFANMTLSGTDSIKVPAGTTAQRPSGTAGDFRFNTTLGKFEGHDGTEFAEIAGGGASAMETNTFTGDGSTRAFTISSTVSNEDDLIIFIDGVYQNKADFVASGTTVTFDTAPVNSRKVVINHIKANIAGSSVTQNAFTGDGSTTAFTLSISPTNENNTQIYIDGVYQHKSTYTVSGTTLTFDTAPVNSTAIDVIMFSQTALNTPASDTVTTSTIADANVTSAKLASNAVTTVKIADDAVTSAKLDTNIAVAGTLASTGVLTANAGVVVDNITIDGQEIDVSSGDFALDVAGGIVLDADDSGTISFKDGGTRYGLVQKATNDFEIKSMIDDGDILFKGLDNSSTITALSLDMSNAGAATFNSTVTANAGVVVDNITIDGTEIDLSSGSLTIDVAGDIILDAGGDDITFKSGGTEFGSIFKSSNDLFLNSAISDGDIKFRGNDGGSFITALTLDMSNAGRATFNENVIVGNNLEVNGADVTITSNIIHAGDTNTFFGFNDADTFRIVTGGSEALRVNSSQNVGIGETSPSTELHVKGTNNSAGDLYTAVGSGNVPSITIQNAGTTDNNNAALFFRNDSAMVASIGARFNSHSNDETQLRFSTTNTSGETRERMVLFGDGKLGLNEFNPAGQLHIKGTDVSASPVSTANQLVLEDTENGISILSASAGAGNIAFGDSGDNFKGGFIYDHSADAMRFLTNGAETMRTAGTSGGVLLVGKTAANNLGTTGFELFGNGGLQQTRDDGFVAAFNRLTTDGDILEFYQNTVKRGSISISGANTSYNTTSDARLKDVTGEAKGLEVINKLNPVAYNWKADGNADEGLIAQEVLDIVPNAVSGSEEDMYQMDYSKLVTPLIKAVQEQQEQIETLKAEVKELKDNG